MDVTLVIPLLNEAESLEELFYWVKKIMNKNDFQFEVIFIDDGSNDNSWDIIERLSSENSEVKGLRFRRNNGKSAALNEGFAHATGDVVITMDADLQDSPEEIPDLYRMIKKEGYDLVSGWKKKRYDPLSKTIPTKLFNAVTSKMSGIKLHDFNCGLKAYSLNVVKAIEVYGEMHRYIPVIAKKAGFDNIGEKVVAHQSRKYGSTKFGVDRFINGFLDLLSIMFVTKFGKKPMHFFGLLGTISFFCGFLITAWLIFSKFYFLEYRMTDRPLFYLGLLAMIIGTQLFLTGFISELISRNAMDRNSYPVINKTGFS